MPDPAVPNRWTPLLQAIERLSRPFGMLLSLVLLVVVLRQAWAADWSALGRIAPLSWAFWTALVGYYFLSPCAEWIIYTRLWGFEWRALPALLRKLVCNELLLDYLGDVQFLAWARSHHAGAVAPFAAVKDVTILSALTGNLVTVALAALAWPAIRAGLPGNALQAMVASICIITLGSTVVVLAGKRLFSCSRRVQLWIAAVLTARTLGGLAVGALLWHLLMPAVPLGSLFVLAVLRMIISRLPLVPSKELLFAGLAVITFGRTADISTATAQIASLVLLMHIAMGGVLGAAHVVAGHRAKGGRGGARPGGG